MPATKVTTAGLDVDAVAGMARLLGDPVRLRVLDHLAREGGSAVTEIAALLGLSGPRLSNHLAKLRAAGLVVVRRHGRHAEYRLADPAIADVIDGLASVPPRLAGNRSSRRRAGAVATARAGGRRVPGDAAASPFRHARSCYDHLAGRVGVEVLRSLQEARAVGPADGDGGSIELGPAAAGVFARLGVDVAGVGDRRRRFAFACLDSTERTPHLGGAVGAALLSSLVERRWVRTEAGSRAVSITPAGRRGLARELGVTA